MNNRFGKSRGIIVLLALLLAFAPMTVFADAQETNELTYVAIGDSLAAGMLSDKSIGEGYAGKIETELKARGYDVNLFNEGVPGATSELVLAGIDGMEYLADADLITLTAGVNDLLFKELGELGKIDDPRYFSEDGINLIMAEANAAFSKKLNSALDATNDAYGAMKDVQVNMEDLQIVIEGNKAAIEDKLTADGFNAFMDILSNMEVEIDDAKNNTENAASHVENASANLNGNKELTDADNDLDAASKNIGQISKKLDEIKGMFGENYILFELSAGSFLTSVQKAGNTLETAETNVSDAIESFKTYQVRMTEIVEKAGLAQTIFQGLTGAGGKIPDVGKNIAGILGKIKKVNPEADIYVMGYYNAFPYVDPAIQEYILNILTNLNLAIEGATGEAGATYIPTNSAFNEDNFQSYLEPTDIHPNDAGYQILADRFISSFADKYPRVEEVPEASEPDSVQITLDAPTEVHGGQLVLIGTPLSTAIQLPKGLPEGTILTVTEEDDIDDADILTPAGDILNFDFQYPNGENYEGEFILYMGYDKDADVDNLDIYHLEDGKWNKQRADLTELEGQSFLTLKVDHFSSYGVFVENRDKADVDENDNSEEELSEDDGGLVVEVEDGDDSPTDGEDEVVQSSVGNLPSTATNYFNLMGIGMLILLAGLGFWVYRRRKGY